MATTTRKEYKMKTPNSIQDLANLLDSLSHRERAVFPVSKELENKFNDAYAVEIYHTILWDTKYQDRNINIKLVDCFGKPLKEGTRTVLNRSKYLRLFTDKYLESIFSILEGNIETEKNGIENKPLAIN